MPNFAYELSFWNQGLSHVAGIDEVGRGALAGPVVTAAVIFPPHFDAPFLSAINDSKLLSPTTRTQLDPLIKQAALSWTISSSPVSQINRQGIVPATQTAMRRAVSALSHPDRLLIDAFYIPRLPHFPKNKQLPIIKGDRLSLSIAAASIIAKVYRDQHMTTLSQAHPHYHWSQNKGYGTLLHRQALKNYGPTKHHRTLFISHLS